MDTLDTVAAFRANQSNDVFIVFFLFNYIPRFQRSTDDERLRVFWWLEVVLKRHADNILHKQYWKTTMKPCYDFAATCLRILKKGANRTPRFPSRKCSERALIDTFASDASIPTKKEIESMLDDTRRLRTKAVP